MAFNMDWLPLIVYLGIGIFFGELSLNVLINRTPHVRFVRAMTYVMAVFLWPIIVIMAILIRIKGDQ